MPAVPMMLLLSVACLALALAASAQAPLRVRRGVRPATSSAKSVSKLWC